MSELLAFFSGHGDLWRKHVAAFVRDALRNEQLKVAPLTRHLFEEALTLYERRLDKEYSLVDCASMRLLIRRLADDGITVPELMEATGMSRPWIYLRLRELADMGQVIQVSRGRWRAVIDDAS